MQGIVLAREFRTLAADLEIASLAELLSRYMGSEGNVNIRQEDKDRFGELVFSINARLTNTRWRRATEHVIAALSLDELLGQANLYRLMAKLTQAANSGQLKIDFAFQKLYHTIASIIEMGAAVVRLLEQERLPTLEDDEGLLELTVSSYGEGPIRAARVARVLDTLEDLTGSVTRFSDAMGRPLRIAILDSGSDVVLILVCSAVVAETVRRLFNEIVNRLRFGQNELAERNFETIAATLAAFENLRQREAAGAIDAETGRLLRHTILSQVRDLLGLGVLPVQLDIPEDPTVDQLLLSQRDRRLLGAGDESV